MSATDELRRLLDGRGIEYDGSFGGIEFYGEDGSVIIACNPKSKDGVLYVHAYLTPEQAVEATLGMGACRVVRSIRHDYEGGYAGTEYEHVLSCGHKTWWGNDDSPDYCPWCGRKVVDA